MTLKRFKAIARQAIRELPAQFHPHVDEIVVLVKAEASEKLRRELRLEPDEDIFGLYEGPALTERQGSDAPAMPPRILLFYEPLLDACGTDAELKREIQITVLHEIGHFFGLDEEQLERLGFG